MEKDYLIQKWLKNSLTNEEKEVFSKLDDFKLNEKIIETAKVFKASKFSNMANFETFKEDYEAKKKSVRKLNWFNSFLKIASVVVVLFGVYYSFFNNQTTKIDTIAGQKLNVTLPDESVVILNALSSITYNEKNWDNERSLKLTGEAYFKVAKGEKFDIKTSDGVVVVVGTQFNVKQRKNYFEVKCFKGIVRVSSNNITKELLAGDTFKIINGIFTNGKTSIIKPEWANSRSVFNAIPFKEVIFELERQYKIKITIDDKNAARLFTGGFLHNNLDNALISVTQPMNMIYELNAIDEVSIYEKEN